MTDREHRFLLCLSCASGYNHGGNEGLFISISSLTTAWQSHWNECERSGGGAVHEGEG